jgi:hypothetical protein
MRPDPIPGVERQDAASQHKPNVEGHPQHVAQKAGCRDVETKAGFRSPSP